MKRMRTTRILACVYLQSIATKNIKFPAILAILEGVKIMREMRFAPIIILASLKMCFKLQIISAV